MTYVYTDKEKERSKKRAASGYWKQRYQRSMSHRRVIGKLGAKIAQELMTSGEYLDGEGFDFKWCNMLVEVKCSSFLPEKNGWNFYVSEKQIATADYLMLIALSPENKLASYWWLPRNAMRRYLKIHGGNLEEYGKYLVEVKS